MKKVGQPDSALEITAGRRTLLGLLRVGVADKAVQSQAANWLRDLTVHHGESLRRLEGNAIYIQLTRGQLTTAALQDHAADWIEGLLLTTKEDTVVTEDELIAKGQRETLPGANARQVGGSHYAKPIQHWDFVASQGYGYLEGQISKYLFRWRDKNGLQDVQKADHFLEKLIEVAQGDEAPISLGEFLAVNNVPQEERSIYVALHAYHETLDVSFLHFAREEMKRVLALARRTVPHQPV